MYKKQHIHFVGIGGIGMSGLARVLLDLKYRVTGSDLRASDITKDLERRGGTIRYGHFPENVFGADVVVVSSAVRDDNPEVQAARAAQIPVIPRAEMLSELMRLKRFGIAVAGAHGKTSTTSMVTSVLEAGNKKPTVIIGGKVNNLGTNAHWGDGDFLVAEADESDGSFLRLTPSIAVVTNIDREHMDYYRDMEEICRTFQDFLDRIPFYGLAIVCGDDPHLRRMLPELKKRYLTYGLGDDVDLQAREVAYNGLKTTYEVLWGEERLGRITIHAPGLHHVLNSLAAVGVGLELEIPFEQIQEGLAKYSGVGRRFDVLGECHGITVVDDYGHHPTEIKATLQALSQAWPKSRRVVLFEPHRYSRTRALMDEFVEVFKEADVLWITEIYPASEEPIVGVSGERLARSIREKWGRPVHYVEKTADLPQAVVPSLQPGDVVLTLGAGSIGRVGRRILSALEQKEAVVAV